MNTTPNRMHEDHDQPVPAQELADYLSTIDKIIDLHVTPAVLNERLTQILQSAHQLADDHRPSVSAADSIHDFIAALRTARELAGYPSYRSIEQVSRKLACAALEQTDIPRMYPLAMSTTYDILCGRRRRLPRWEWVASYIRVLRLTATHNGLSLDEIGTIRQWATKFHAAHAAMDKDAPPATKPVLAARNAEPPERRPRALGTMTNSRVEDADGQQPGANDKLGAGVPATDSPRQAALARLSYGPTGKRLLLQARAGDAEALYQLAVLLACDDHIDEAIHWLWRSAMAGCQQASRLINSPVGANAMLWPPHPVPTAPGLPLYWQVTQAAFDIGLSYEAAGKPHSAVVFLARAAANGHTEAAYRAGLHCRQIGKQSDAAIFFSRAARNGHPHAQQASDALLPQLEL